MKILLGSTNPSKKQSLELALAKLRLDDYEIIEYPAKSNVPSRPIGFEIIRGAENRNKELKEYARNNGIAYDYLCSIEGGFSIDETGLPFIVTYCVSETKEGRKSTGKSLGLRLTKTMYDYVKAGHSLNKVIEEITGQNNTKQTGGITGYLSYDSFDRNKIDADAILSSFNSLLFSERRNLIDEKIKSKKL